MDYRAIVKPLYKSLIILLFVTTTTTFNKHRSMRRKSILRDELDIAHRPSHARTRMPDLHMILNLSNDIVIACAELEPAAFWWAIL